MKKYDFVILKNEDGETYQALPKNSFEEINVHNTYDNGQSVSHEDAGDCLSINTNKAVKIANKVRKEEYPNKPVFKIGDIVHAFDFPYVFEEIVYGNNLNVDVDFTTEYQQCTAYNYWDGNNWKSIIVAYDNLNWECSELLEDKELIEELCQAINDMVYKDDSHGIKYFEHEKWSITQSIWANNPFSYELTEK